MALTPMEERMCAGLRLAPEVFGAQRDEQAARRAKPGRAERADALRRMLPSATTATEREALEAHIRLLEEAGDE